VTLPEIASKLDEAIGLTLVSASDGNVTLRLDPGELAVVTDDDLTYLHGGALATCIDTAAWYAAESAAPSEGAEWVVATLHMEGLRLAGDEPHSVSARCLRAGRSRAVVDVEIAPQADPGRVLTVGRVSLARAPSPAAG
jgi:acyl-coenzyme A thioesterase PaaI-like protein